MPRLFNTQSHRDLRRSLRNNTTKPEQIMWFRLSRDQLGYRFRRQYGVGRYILDFYCPELRLAVEVDGDSHAEPESVEYDTCRDEYCASVGILTLRFTNLEVQESLESVVEQVRETCHLRAQSSSSARS